MKESTSVTIITIFLLLLGLGSIYLSMFYTSFNFYKTELSINDNEIKETLNYQPNKDYHTLYRNFKSFITTTPVELKADIIIIDNVDCSEGESYVKDSTDCYFPSKGIRKQCLPYTAFNEYGCGFGYQKGFKKGKDYQITATYILRPKNLIKINDKYYIKFVAYSRDKHKTLIKNNNLLVKGKAITKDFYLPLDDVIIYIPYTKSDIANYQIIQQNDFIFDDNIVKKLFIILFSLLPAIIFLIIWRFYGREHTYADIPPELSFYPNERKGWEVASFFHPPFATIDKTFFSSLLLDLHRKKVIDLYLENKDLYIKINKTNKQLDNIESEFISFVKELQSLVPEDYIKNDYLNLQKALNKYGHRYKIRLKLEKIKDLIKEESKQYIDNKGAIILLATSFILMMFAIFAKASVFVFLIAIILFIILYIKSSILIRFKKSYYVEYQQWQAFRKFLSHSYSIKNMPHKAVILWEQYLVYGCALGVAKQVLKELKQANIITAKDYNLYNTSINKASISFATASGSHGGGGGFGGASAGGIGGGGGGGR